MSETRNVGRSVCFVARFGVNDPEHNVLGAAATGGIATVFHDAIMTPLDVIKQRLQVRRTLCLPILIWTLLALPLLLRPT